MEEFARSEGGLWRLLITCTHRTPAEQDAIWLQGRADLEAVNAARARVGLGSIEAAENRKVTWTRASQHTVKPARAVDLAVAFDPDGVAGKVKPAIEWDDERRYRKMGRMAERLGLVWGGSWERNPDLCHVELRRTA